MYTKCFSGRALQGRIAKPGQLCRGVGSGPGAKCHGVFLIFLHQMHTMIVPLSGLVSHRAGECWYCLRGAVNFTGSLLCLTTNLVGHKLRGTLRGVVGALFRCKYQSTPPVGFVSYMTKGPEKRDARQRTWRGARSTQRNALGRFTQPP
jgi:hypothetical protein